MKPRVVVTIPFTRYLAGALFSLPFRVLAAIVRMCVAVPIVRYVCLALALVGGAFTYSSYKAAHCHGDAYGFATGRNIGISCDRPRSPRLLRPGWTRLRTNDPKN